MKIATVVCIEFVSRSCENRTKIVEMLQITKLKGGSVILASIFEGRASQLNECVLDQNLAPSLSSEGIRCETFEPGHMCFVGATTTFLIHQQKLGGRWSICVEDADLP